MSIYVALFGSTDRAAATGADDPHAELLLAHHGAFDVRGGKDRVVEASSPMPLPLGTGDLVRWADGRIHVWCLDSVEEAEIL